MARKRQREGGGIKLFLTGLIIAAEIDGQAQRVLEAQNACAPLPLTFRPQELFDICRDGEFCQGENIGLLDMEIRIHVRHERRFCPDRAISFLVR